MVCPQGHSFDIARSGYINLLQPQDRRSKHPGDSVAAVAARRSLHDQGISQPMLAAVSEMISAKPADVVLDIGSGDGFYLGSLQLQSGFQASGVDIAIPAVELAARRYPNSEWIVANADRFLPFADGSFSLVMSLTARLNPAESHRVLQPLGRLLIALPAPDDLIELRRSGKDRSARTIETFSPQFEVVKERRVTTSADLDSTSMEKILLSIYRPMQHAPATAGRVTFSLDLLLLQPRKPS